jgi:hypothetical protein
MLVPAVAFWQVVLALHIVAVVAAFGVTFAYPVIFAVGSKLDRRAMPWFHRVQVQLGRRLVNPGLLVVVLAGVYLASKLHQWSSFYVQWGIGVAIVLGGLEGAFMIRQETKLAELAQRDIEQAGTREVAWSPEYEALARRVGMVGALMGLLVVVTIYLMTVQAGAS